MKLCAMWLLACGMSLLLVSCDSLATSQLTADQIVNRNIEATGGIEAWHKVKTMVWSGHIVSHHAASSSLPFVLEMKRPDKTRFEIRAQGQIATRIFDGAQGWKMQPARGGVPRISPYTKYELQYAREAEGIGGPLLDLKSRGVLVSLDGTDKIEGRKAYRLLLKLPSGTSRHLWVDAENYLMVKYEREARNSFGMTGKLYVYYGSYKTINGMKIAMRIASGTDKSKYRDEMILDKVVINPALPDWVFSKPIVQPRQPTVTVGRQAPASGQGSPLLNLPGHMPAIRK